MFGIWRYLLALMVVIYHLGPPGEKIGMYAVFCFYALSGFLMQQVLATRYPHNRDGIRRFLVNRALRIYPPYFAAAVCTLPVILAFPGIAAEVNNYLVVPGTPELWLLNLGIVGQVIDTRARLVPPAWSLSVELVAYVAMALVLRGPKIVPAWFAASAGYTIWLVATGADLPARYFPLLSASLAFSSGALLYQMPPLPSPRRHLLAGLGLFLLANAVATPLEQATGIDALYTTLAAGLYVMAALRAIRRDRVPAWLRRLDGTAGDLAYPLFLCHYPVAVLVAAATGAEARSLAILLVALPGVHGVAWAIHRLVEQPIAPWRDRVRGTAAGPTPAAEAPVAVAVAEAEPVALAAR